MANEFTNDIPHMAEELRSTMSDLEGVIYVLRVLAEQRPESVNALNNQVRELDDIFVRLDSMADALEEMK